MTPSVIDAIAMAASSAHGEHNSSGNSARSVVRDGAGCSAVIRVPDVVRNRARLVGAGGWVDELPDLVAELERRWSFTTGRCYEGGTEAFVAEADLHDGRRAVLKVLVPRRDGMEDHELTVLRLAAGHGCPELYAADPPRLALLLERLGPSLFELAMPYRERLPILVDTARALWRPAPGCGLPTGAHKGRWLIDFVVSTWERLGRPCPERTIDHAVACAEHRIAAHDDERAVLVHGDVHQWNTLRAGEGYKLVDPDGLLAQPEYDLGIIMREDPLELLEEGPRSRAAWLARRTGLDEHAIWEWGVVERTSTALSCIEVGLQPVGAQMLGAANAIAADPQMR